MSEDRRDDDGGAVVVDRPPVEDRERLKPPPNYAVIFLNDDYTPMEWVMAVLTRLFNKSPEEAEKLMMEVHEKGQALIATYQKDIAETKVFQVNSLAQSSGHPFKADVQPLH